MTQDADADRTQVIHRLKESGFEPQTIDQILLLIDAMMIGLPAVAHVLVAVTEVCKACGLDKTHQQVADALACLAAEVLQYQNECLDAHPTPYAVRGLALPKGILSLVAGPSMPWALPAKDSEPAN